MMENATMDMGLKLRELREKKGLSVEDVSRHLKIPANTLLTIENGKYEQLPHPVYARSFAKMYGQELGMDPDELNAGLEEIFGASPETQPSSVYTPLDETSGRSVWKFPLLVVVLCCILGGGWGLYAILLNDTTDGLLDQLPGRTSMPLTNEMTTQNSEESFSPPSTSTNVSELGDANEMSGKQATPDQKGLRSGSLEMGDAPQMRETHPASDKNVFVPEPSNVSLTELSPEMPKEAALPAASSAVSMTSESVEAPNTGHEVVIEATAGDCWLRVTQPGVEKKDIFLHKGQRVVLPYAQEMTVRFGNIFGVTILNDGEPFDYAKDGAPVRTLNFPL